MERKTLTLRKSVPADPQKIARSLEIGFRFIDRKGRYILQRHIVMYDTRTKAGAATEVERVAVDSTWIDIPLVPETYGEAQA